MRGHARRRCRRICLRRLRTHGVRAWRWHTHRNAGWSQSDFQHPPLATLNFPTGVTHTYVDSVPVNHGTIIIGRRAGLLMAGTGGGAAFNGRVLTFGNVVNFGGNDRLVYDPCNMRSFVVSNAFTGVSVPEPFRSRSHSGMMSFTLHYEGAFTGIAPSNGVRFYVKQYRGAGVFLRDLNLCMTDSRQTVVGSAERTLMGASGFGEDIDPSLDYFELFGENVGNDDFNLLLGQIKVSFVPQL